MIFLFQISVRSTIQGLIVISSVWLRRIIVDNLFRMDSNMNSKHATEIEKKSPKPSSGENISGVDLECEATCLINEEYRCDYSGTTQGERRGEKLRWAERINTNWDQEGEKKEKMQTCAEPFKTPLINWTSCSMVSVGSPGRKYCSLDVLRMITEGTATSLQKKKQNKTRRIQLLIFNLSTLYCHYHSASLDGNKLWLHKVQIATHKYNIEINKPFVLRAT